MIVSRNGIVMGGLLVASTVGAGIFTLPWIFERIGWAAGFGWLAALSALVIFAQFCYWRVLDSVAERQRLVGLARTHLGDAWGLLATVAVLGGTLLTLIVYLTLAERFLAMVLPLPGRTGLVLFWGLAVLPTTLAARKFAAASALGALAKCALIAAVLFAASSPGAMFRSVPAAGGVPLGYLGAILFALAGWTAVEPMYEYWRSLQDRSKTRPLLVIAAAVAGVAFLYGVFVVGIFGSLEGGSYISPDTLSGLIGWADGRLALLAVLGLFALWTPYGPTMREADHALQKDLRWGSASAFAATALLPLSIVFLGGVSLVQLMSFAGALFVGLQYVAILVLARKMLRPSPGFGWGITAAIAVFSAAALYEVYAVVVH